VCARVTIEKAYNAFFVKFDVGGSWEMKIAGPFQFLFLLGSFKDRFL
jgi:hypothetical protein